MRIIVPVLFLVFNIQVFGQEADSAVLTFSGNSYDFGRIYEDQGTVQHTFKIRNTGSAPLQIYHVRSNCGCTSPAWTQEAIASGEDGYITVEYDPQNVRGAFHKTIQVQSNAVNQNMFLTISGTVLPPLKKDKMNYKVGELSVKSKHINLGYLYKGTVGHAGMTIANLTHEPMQLSLKNVPRQIEAYIPEVLQPGEYGLIEIDYNTELVDEWDVVIDRISLVINRKEDIRYNLAVTANIREDFRSITEEQVELAPRASFTHPVIRYDTIPEDNILQCRFELINAGASDLIIRAVKPSCGIDVELPKKNLLAPGETTYIVADLDPKGRSGEIKNSITVITNDPKEYKQYLIIEGYIR